MFLASSLVWVVIATGSTACSRRACTLGGCGPGVQILLPEISTAGGTTHVRYCVDGECEDRTFSPDQLPSLLSVEAKNETVRISVEVKDDTRVLARLEETKIHLQESKPNGPQCGPTCYHGKVRVPPA